MSKILEVKKLKISFRTNNGTVKAVRDISFDLNKGETLAIVGESGSGKSVTSKAILGILAGNSIVDGGEILYDGRDLLKVSEDEMHKLRGDKIAMIFQDPLSSLNPIVKIGKQITEAMILKNKASRKESRVEFNEELALLKKTMILACSNNDPEQVNKINEMINTFDQFNILSLKLQNSYNESKNCASYILSKTEDFLFKASKNQKLPVVDYLKSTLSKLNSIDDAYFISRSKDSFDKAVHELQGLKKTYDDQFNLKARFQKIFKGKSANILVPENVVSALHKLNDVLNNMISVEEPNFFRIGYYNLKNPNEDLTKLSIKEIEDKTLNFLDKDFMIEFISYIDKAIMLLQEKSVANKKVVVEELKSASDFFTNGSLEKKDVKEKIKKLITDVNSCINELDVRKDTLSLTFGMSLKTAVNLYFKALAFDKKDEIRYNKQKAKWDKLTAKGKKVDWKVVPRKEFDEQAMRLDIVSIIQRLVDKYENDLKNNDFDVRKASIGLIDWFKDKASRVVTKLTKAMAKEKAIHLMEEVGIPEPRIRFYQYPFEFSGGMRQRIVIAIALAANPDILICDEPTTALDVTIQSQILELINKLKVERNLSIIFITHDLGVVANMADRIAVMYAGKIVEYGTAEDVFYAPAHPYTWALLSSMPDLDTKEKLDSIPGTPPNMIYPPVGDAFAARNKYALKIDFEKEPPLFEITPTHYAATWLLHPNAPKVEMPKIISERIERMKKSGGNDNE